MGESAASRWFRPAKSNTGQTSPTPILDLLEPIPKPADEIVTGKFAFPFLTLVALAVINQNYPLLAVLLGFLPALFFAVAIHECGHIASGWCAGLRFRGVEIGPLCIRRIQNKWSFRLRPRTYIGAAQMQLRRIRVLGAGLSSSLSAGPSPVIFSQRSLSW
jgi:hypothetical protein